MKIKLNNIFKNKKQKKGKEEKIKSIPNEKFTRIRKVHTGNNINKNTRKDILEYKYKQFKLYDNNINENSKVQDTISNTEKKHVRKGAIFDNIEDVEEKEAIKPQKSKGNKRFSKSYLLLFFFMLVLAVVSVSLNIKKNKELNNEDYAVFNNTDKTDESSVSETKNELQDNNTSNKDTNYVKNEDEIKNIKEKKETKNKKKKQKIKKKKIKPLSFSKPIDGEIIKIYSIDKVIYSKTLELWKTHDGIDIKADKGTVVKSIEKGIVEKIYNDSFYGYTIVIDHGQGYKSSYSNLSEDVLVKAKQTINKGTKLGYIGDTAIGEIKDEPHLHFMLFLNNENVDPTSIFK